MTLYTVTGRTRMYWTVHIAHNRINYALWTILCQNNIWISTVQLLKHEIY